MEDLKKYPFELNGYYQFAIMKLKTSGDLVFSELGVRCYTSMMEYVNSID